MYQRTILTRLILQDESDNIAVRRIEWVYIVQVETGRRHQKMLSPSCLLGYIHFLDSSAFLMAKDELAISTMNYSTHTITRRLGIPEKHLRIGHVEHRVRHVG